MDKSWYTILASFQQSHSRRKSEVCRVISQLIRMIWARRFQFIIEVTRGLPSSQRLISVTMSRAWVVSLPWSMTSFCRTTSPSLKFSTGATSLSLCWTMKLKTTGLFKQFRSQLHSAIVSIFSSPCCPGLACSQCHQTIKLL